MKRQLQICGYYRHFKNHFYKVLNIGEHTETGEKLVVYQPLYGEQKCYVRPFEMFIEEVPPQKENPTGQKYRFMSLQELNLTVQDIHYN